MAVLVTGAAIAVLLLAMTPQGHVIDAATQRFMLYYAGVLALLALCASVSVGLLATDRIFMTPGHRVMAQAVHRAVSFGALMFLIIHITTEVLAQRSHVLDGFIPFLSPYRTFYIGLGTIASDLIVLLVITSIMRKRFTGHGKAWRWRAIHYSAYLAFVFGVWHGLLAGRPGKPYVDWSYGFLVALVAFAILVRFLALRLRPKEMLSAPPAGGQTTSSSPLRAAALSMTQAQLGGGTIQLMPAGVGAVTQARGALPRQEQLMLTAPVANGSFGAYDSDPYASEPYGIDPYGRSVIPLGAPPYGDARQPHYEPGYVGPPRYDGAPRGATGPMPRLNTGPMRALNPGQMPGNTGPMRSNYTGLPPGNGTGLPPGNYTGPMPGNYAGPLPNPNSGPMPIVNTGPMPVAGSGPMPVVSTGSMPRVSSGAMPRNATGPMPRTGTGPMPGGAPRTGSAPRPPYPPQDPYGPPEAYGQEAPVAPYAGPWPARDLSGSDQRYQGGHRGDERGGRTGGYPDRDRTGGYPDREWR